MLYSFPYKCIHVHAYLLKCFYIFGTCYSIEREIKNLFLINTPSSSQLLTSYSSSGNQPTFLNSTMGGWLSTKKRAKANLQRNLIDGCDNSAVTFIYVVSPLLLVTWLWNSKDSLLSLLSPMSSSYWDSWIYLSESSSYYFPFILYLSLGTFYFPPCLNLLILNLLHTYLKHHPVTLPQLLTLGGISLSPQ